MKKIVRALSAMQSITEAATGEPMPLPVASIEHPAAGYWYAARVAFDANRHDPNGLARAAVALYVRRHRAAFFFKNGNPRRGADLSPLAAVVAPYIQA